MDRTLSSHLLLSQLMAAFQTLEIPRRCKSISCSQTSTGLTPMRPLQTTVNSADNRQIQVSNMRHKVHIDSSSWGLQDWIQIFKCTTLKSQVSTLVNKMKLRGHKSLIHTAKSLSRPCTLAWITWQDTPKSTWAEERMSTQTSRLLK